MDHLTFFYLSLPRKKMTSTDGVITLHSLWLAYRPAVVVVQGVCLLGMVTWVTLVASVAALELLVPQ